MYLMLEREEQKLLLELLESRSRELHPEIRRSRNYPFREELKKELDLVQRLIHNLHEAECDVRA